MKDISTSIKESFYKNVGVGDLSRLYNYYFCHDGFQFGWSAGISDSQWFPMFDMNFLRNYYQKYFDPRVVNAGVANSNWLHWSIREKYDRYTKGMDFFHYCQGALIFAILNARCQEPDEKAIKEALSKFLNKENGADKDTKIEVEKRQAMFGKADTEYRVYITNNRVAHISRPLYITLISKEVVKRDN